MIGQSPEVRSLFIASIGLATIAVTLKAILVFKKKGLSVPALCTSFIRIYRTDLQKAISSNSWRRFMAYNNFINYVIYCLVILIAVLLTVGR